MNPNQSAHEPAPLFVNNSNRLILFILIFLVLFAPLAHGSIDSWAYLLVRAGVLVMLSAYLLQGAYTRELNSTTPIFWVPALFFLGILVVQILPMPQSLRQILSPLPFQHSVLLPTAAASGGRLAIGSWTSISIYPQVTWEALFDVATWFLSFWIIFNATRVQDKQQILVSAMVWVGLSESVYGLFEYLSGRQRIFFFFKTHYRQDLTGTYINHNHFAGLMDLTIPILNALLWLALVQMNRLPTQPDQAKWKKTSFLRVFLLAGALGLMCLSLVLSHSRGGMIAVGCALSFFGYLVFHSSQAPIRHRTKVTAMTAPLILVLLSGELIPRFSYTVRDAPERIGVWKDALRIAKDFPLWGTGLGTFRYILPNYRQQVDIVTVDEVPRQATWNYAHNDYLQLLVECGIMGILLAAWGIFLWFRLYFSGLKSVSSPNDRILRYGLGSSVVAMLVHSVMDFNLHIPANALLFAFCLALAVNYGAKTRPQGREVEQSR
ncbi:MAG: O-antigen ligase family protein [Terriglobia bacterium]